MSSSENVNDGRDDVRRSTKDQASKGLAQLAGLGAEYDWGEWAQGTGGVGLAQSPDGSAPG